MAIVAMAVGLSVRPLVASRSAEAENGYGLAAAAAQGPISMGDKLGGEISTTTSTLGEISRTVDGLELTASNFRWDGIYLLADMCFDFPDKEDWTIWSASLRYDEILIQDYSSVPIELRYPEADGTQTVMTLVDGTKSFQSEPASKGDMGGRCDTLSFELPADSKAHKYMMTIDSIAAAPREGETCTPAALANVQSSVSSRSEGITVGCAPLSIEGGAGAGFVILAKPAGMAQDQAEAIVFSQDVFLDAFGAGGPWTFAVPLDQ